MNRPEKAVVIDSLKQQLKDSRTSFIVGYRGLSVGQLERLRQDLNTQGSVFKVAKARLMKRAIADAGNMASLDPYLKDQIAFVFSSSELSSVAKILYNFSKKNKALDIMVGYADDKMFDKEEVLFIASLPSREQLLAQLCNVLMAPVTSFARLLDQVGKKQAEKNETVEKP